MDTSTTYRNLVESTPTGFVVGEYATATDAAKHAETLEKQGDLSNSDAAGDMRHDGVGCRTDAEQAGRSIVGPLWSADLAPCSTDFKGFARSFARTMVARVDALEQKRASQIIRSKKHRARHPGRCKARAICKDAVRRGLLEKLPCAKCGTTENVQAHHRDYSKPFDVDWLCRPCHYALHKQLGDKHTKRLFAARLTEKGEWDG